MMRVVVFVLLLIPCLVKAQTKKPVAKKPVSTASKPASSSANTLKSSVTRGQVVYAKYCLTCHQVDGSGVPNMNPPLIQTKWTLGSKTVLIEQVLKGSKGKAKSLLAFTKSSINTSVDERVDLSKENG